MTVEYFGKDSHAAFAPWEGINALDAFVNAYMNVATLRQSLLAGDRVHCMVNHAGDASNIIASYSKSTWGIRSATEARLEVLVPKVEACFEAAALSTGCRLEINRTAHPYLTMVNNPVMTDLFAANSESLGRPMPTEAENGSSGGSSDMGNVSQGGAVDPPDRRHRSERCSKSSTRVCRGHDHAIGPQSIARRGSHDGVHDHRHGRAGRLERALSDPEHRPNEPRRPRSVRLPAPSSADLV